jgi:hypothetical protein
LNYTKRIFNYQTKRKTVLVAMMRELLKIKLMQHQKKLVEDGRRSGRVMEEWGRRLRG